MLKCSKCGEMKDETEFTRDNSLKNRGFKCYWCKKCKQTYAKNYRKRKPKKPKLKHCNVCGTPFFARGRGNYTTCNECLLIIRRKHEPRKCKGCGLIFTPKLALQTYCTKQCHRKNKPKYITKNSNGKFQHGEIYVLEDLEGTEFNEGWKLEVRP